MLKKMTLLAGMALAAIAFAVPASASALEWTDNGAAFTGTASDTLSGFIAFGEPGGTEFGCVAEVGISATGGSANGSVTSFTPNTAECAGTGPFSGCELESDSTTGLPAAVSIVETSKLTMSNASIVIHNVYKPGCLIEKVTLTVSHLTFNLNGRSDLTDVTVEGLALAHITAGGVESTETVGVFGTVGTATDTLSVS